jgi:FAD/FMN-containing dehydrogenase
VLATDNSIYRLVPQAIAFPRGTDDLSRIGRLLAEPRFAGVRIAPRGGGTGTNGQSLTDGLVVDVSRHMDRVLEINAEERWVRVEAGVVKDQLNAALAPHGLFFAPELSTSNRATIGGMVSTDASGQGSCLYGKTRDHVLELTSVLADGTVWTSRPLGRRGAARGAAPPGRVGAVHRAVDAIQREHAAEIEARFPRLNRCLTGYDLAHIRDREGRFDLNAVLCGAEGTLAVLAEAKLNVLPIPKRSALVNLRYGSFDAALRDAQALMAFGPASIETVDSKVLALAQEDIVWDGVREFFPDDGGEPAVGVNLVEFVGHSEEEVEVPLRRITGALAAEGAAKGRRGFTVARGHEDVERVWAMRKKAVGLLGNMKGDKRPIPFVEDTAVPPENLADYIAEFRGALDRRGLAYGMFGHVDAGVLHVRPAIDLKDPAQERLIREVTEEVVALTRKHGGLLWGEHGKGVRSEFSPGFFGPLYPTLQAVKAAFDPQNQLNPGKIAVRRWRAPHGRWRAHEGPGRPHHPARGPGRLRRGAALQRQRRLLQLGPRRPDVPVLEGDARAAAFAQGPGPADPGMAAAARGARLRPGRGEPAPAPRRGWRTLPARLRNSWARRRGEPDFSHEVKEALDGCLACKSCVGGCPIKVNVPSFRAKFLELYYGRYLRPARDYLVASLEHLLPAVARVPRLYNGVVGSAWAAPACACSGWSTPPGCPASTSGASSPPAASPSPRRRRCGGSARPSGAGRSSSCRTPSPATTRPASSSTCSTWSACSASRRGWRPSGRTARRCTCTASSGRSGAWPRPTRPRLRGLAATGVDLVGIDPVHDAYLPCRGTPKRWAGRTSRASCSCRSGRRGSPSTRRCGPRMGAALSAPAALHRADHRHGRAARLAGGVRPARPPAGHRWPRAAAAWRAPTATRPSTARCPSASTA